MSLRPMTLYKELGHLARVEEGRSSTGKRPLGRPRRRWEDKY